MENWKDIECYEGLYQVSDKGNVKSTKKDKYLKQANCKGYKRVGLSKNSKVKHFSVHRLVAKAFIPNPNNLPVINHKDENKTNNSVENLEWCTVEYNNRYGTASKRHGITQRNRKDCSKPVEQYDLDNNIIRTYQSVSETRNYGFSFTSVSKCCLGVQKKPYRGYIWKFKGNDKDSIER